VGLKQISMTRKTQIKYSWHANILPIFSLFEHSI